MNKICNRCRQIKPIARFGRGKGYKNGQRPSCKDCINASQRKRYSPERNRKYKDKYNSRDPERKRRYNLKAIYGISLADYQKMLEQQKHKCAICGTGKPAVRNFRKLSTPFHIDHCHETNTIRGLLCANCNLGIGNLKHSEALLLAAIRYLKAAP